MLPLVILKQIRNYPFLIVVALPGSDVDISSDSFMKWLNHFIDFVKQTTERKLFLVD
jgi:hypothetical protein